MKKSDNKDTLYTYYKVEYKNCHPFYDETICRSLDEVKEALQVVDTDLDDDSDFEPGCKPTVIITGIGMSENQYNAWLERCKEDNEF